MWPMAETKRERKSLTTASFKYNAFLVIHSPQFDTAIFSELGSVSKNDIIHFSILFHREKFSQSFINHTYTFQSLFLWCFKVNSWPLVLCMIPETSFVHSTKDQLLLVMLPSHPSRVVVRILVWAVALTPMGTFFRLRRLRKKHLENILPSRFWERGPRSSWRTGPSGPWKITFY